MDGLNINTGAAPVGERVSGVREGNLILIIFGSDKGNSFSPRLGITAAFMILPDKVRGG